MKHEHLITAIQEIINDNNGSLDFVLDGLKYLRPLTCPVRIISEGLYTDYGTGKLEDFYSFEELSCSDLEIILTQIQCVA